MPPPLSREKFCRRLKRRRGPPANKLIVDQLGPGFGKNGLDACKIASEANADDRLRQRRFSQLLYRPPFHRKAQVAMKQVEGGGTQVPFLFAWFDQDSARASALQFAKLLGDALFVRSVAAAVMHFYFGLEESA